MILTGKCREAFINHYGNIDELPEVCKNALIIEFFDAMFIYVNAIRYSCKFKPIVDYELQEVYNSRTEATTEAIKKANEIFNSRNND